MFIPNPWTGGINTGGHGAFGYGSHVYPAPPAAAHVQMTAGPLMSRVRMTKTGGKAAR